MAAVDEYEIGQRIGDWTILDKVTHNNGTVNRRSLLCRCVCGAEKVVRPDAMKTGGGCGCSVKSQAGLSNTPEYWSWVSMLRRCYDQRNRRYQQYGGRGVVVCDEWRDSFLTFLADMGPRPDGCTLDRKDVDGNYNKTNCRWSSVLAQARNRTTTHYVTLGGTTLCLTEWAEIKKISPHTLRSRLRRGWSVEKALTTPTRSMGAGDEDV